MKRFIVMSICLCMLYAAACAGAEVQGKFGKHASGRPVTGSAEILDAGLVKVAAESVAINEVNFPDAVFRELVSVSFDLDGDDVLTEQELAAVTNIDVHGRNIHSLKGVEYFTSLTLLNCYDNPLGTLDVSRNTLLEGLSCADTQLKEIDVSNNPHLFDFRCHNNELTHLDLSANTELYKLRCYNNKLRTLDLSKNTALNEIACANNELVSVNLSSCKDLEDLRIFGNHLSSLDVSGNTALTFLNCSSNDLTQLDLTGNSQLVTLYCSNNRITELDLTSNRKLESVVCDNNRIAKLDLSMNARLVNLLCPNNALSELDLTHNIMLELVDCTGNNITEINTTYNFSLLQLEADEGVRIIKEEEQLDGAVAINWQHFPDEIFRNYVRSSFDKNGDNILDEREIAAVIAINLEQGYHAPDEGKVTLLKGIEYFTSLESLNVYDNKLRKLDLSHNTKLRMLDCQYNEIASLDVSMLHDLEEIYCNGNKLTVLDVANCPRMKKLSCHINYITELDVSSLQYLEELDCGFNKLNTLDVSHCPLLRKLNYSYTGLAYLDLSNLQYLEELDCSLNPNTVAIDLEHCPNLRELDCSFTGIISFDLRGLDYLSVLDCSFNSLVRLDLSPCTRLIELRCNNNSLEYLNISKCTILQILDCDDNSLTRLDLSHNPALDQIECRRNRLQELDVSNNTVLTRLHCEENALQKLDVSSNILLKELYCQDNNINELNLSNAISLETLNCSGNNLTVIDASSNERLSTLDCRNNPLTRIILSEYYLSGYGFTHLGYESLYSYTPRTLDNSIQYDGTVSVEYAPAYGGGTYTSVAIDEAHFPDEAFREYVSTNFDTDSDDVLSSEELLAVRKISFKGKFSDRPKSVKGIEYFSALRDLTLYYCDLISLDLSAHTNLFRIDVGSCKIQKLTIGRNSSLVHLDCGLNKLTELDVSGCPSLQVLDCVFNQLTSLDVSGCPLLRQFNCSWNYDMKAIDLSSNTLLTDLNCHDTAIETLDLSSNFNLEWVYAYSSNITDINLSNVPFLTGLFCYSNDISELAVSDKYELFFLNCGNNNIKELDVRNCERLRSFSCAMNQLKELDVSNNTGLIELYCHNNQLKELDVSHCPELQKLSCTNNRIGTLDITGTPLLTALDCGGNYLTGLDTGSNPQLTELYVSGTTIRSVDLSVNISLISFDCISTDITALDLSANTLLEAVNCYGNSRLEALYITSSDNSAYPFKTDMREYVGNSFTKITSLKAYSKKDTEILPSFSRAEGIAMFASRPHYIVYEYETGYTGYAPENAVPRKMSVRMGLPTHSFTYLPKIEAKVISVDSKVISVDGAISFYASDRTGEDDSDEQSGEGLYKRPSDNEEFYVETEDDSDGISSSGGGGCDSGFGILALCAVMFVRRKHKKLLVPAILVLCMASCAWAEVDASDYTLPTDYEIYDISGTYSTNFVLTEEQKEIIANFAGISAEKVHTFAEATVSNTWEVLPQDFYNLAKNGEYGGVVLPVIENAGVKDRYVILCTFSTDIEPGELLSIHGFEVDPSTREAVYSEGKDYLAEFITMDDEFNRIESVPANRRVYAAVSFTPQYVNTGIVGVIRGHYVEEDDPLDRLDSNVAQRIADYLGIDPSELKYLTRANIGRPVPPTAAMKEYVNSDDHEIIANLPTVSVDQAGRYVVPVTLSDDVWETLKGKKISDYKFYALNDAELGEKQFRPAIINGLLGTWELFSLTGQKLDTFGVKEFLMVGFLDAGKPLSMYVARLLLMLLMGGCDAGCWALGGLCAVLGLLFMKLR